MKGFFERVVRNPESGDIQISDVRYLMMRTESLAIELQSELKKTFGEAGGERAYFGAPAEATAAEGEALYNELADIFATAARAVLAPED